MTSRPTCRCSGLAASATRESFRAVHIQADPVVQDGLVNVAVGDVNVLNDARIGVAAQVAAQVWALRLGQWLSWLPQ